MQVSGAALSSSVEKLTNTKVNYASQQKRLKENSNITYTLLITNCL